MIVLQGLTRAREPLLLSLLLRQCCNTQPGWRFTGCSFLAHASGGCGMSLLGLTCWTQAEGLV